MSENKETFLLIFMSFVTSLAVGLASLLLAEGHAGVGSFYAGLSTFMILMVIALSQNTK